MAVLGSIAEAARAELPITWDALASAPQYGDGLLQRKVDVVKEYIFGSVITVNAEDTYARRVQNYAGKLVALELIGPGIDFWLSQSTTATTFNPREVVTFESRIEGLEKLRAKLLADTRAMEPEVAVLINRIIRRRSGPRISSAGEVQITPSIFEHPRPYIETERS
jgi:hypothetical protein